MQPKLFFKAFLYLYHQFWMRSSWKRAQDLEEAIRPPSVRKASSYLIRLSADPWVRGKTGLDQHLIHISWFWNGLEGPQNATQPNRLPSTAKCSVLWCCFRGNWLRFIKQQLLFIKDAHDDVETMILKKLGSPIERHKEINNMEHCFSEETHIKRLNKGGCSTQSWSQLYVYAFPLYSCVWPCYEGLAEKVIAEQI